ncbi:MAG: DUF4430 domain-containing protein [Coriobacteriales bacterium]|jgi:hypothetical protein|nr:DUF4430 domain-containing protein [Coriobacteriales bacterium]
MKQLRRITILFLTLCLTLCLTLTLLPVSALAEDGDGTGGESAEAAETLIDVELYWGQASSTAQKALIKNNLIEVYDSDGMKKDPVTDPARHGTLGSKLLYPQTAKWRLAPGNYTWRGYEAVGKPVGMGVFVVEEPIDKEQAQKPQRFKIDRLNIKVSNADSMGQGSDFELFDYLGNKIEPSVVNYKKKDPALGATDCTYLVIMRSLADESMYFNTGDLAYVGQAYHYVITPREESYAVADGYAYWAQSDLGVQDNVTVGMSPALPLSSAKSITVETYPPSELSISVPAGAALQLATKERHYKVFTSFPRYGEIDKETVEGRWIYRFRVPRQVYFHYVAGGGDFEKEQQNFYIRSEHDTFAIDVALEPLENVVATDDNNLEWEANLLLNTDASRSVHLGVGETFDLMPHRFWQAIGIGTLGNDYAEPDYHLQIIDPERDKIAAFDSFGGISTSFGAITLTNIGGMGRTEFRIKGEKAGIAFIKISYDAVTYRNPIGQSPQNVQRNTDYTAYYHNPIEPKNIAIIPVLVGGADNSGIDPQVVNYTEPSAGDQCDTFYFPDTQESALYSFSPTSTYGDVSVRVHQPVWNTDFSATAGAVWESGWTVYGTKPSGTVFNVELRTGNNVIEMRSGNAVKYHVIFAEAIPVSITNMSKLGWEYGEPVEVGDEIYIRLTQMNAPVPKLAGIYNLNMARTVYTMLPDNGTLQSSYDYGNGFGDNTLNGSAASYYGTFQLGQGIKFKISAAGETSLIDGHLIEGWYGSPWGSHRNIPTSGYTPNTNAVDRPSGSAKYSMLPEFRFYTAPEEGVKAPVTFTGLDPAATLVVKSAGGSEYRPETTETDAGTIAVQELPVGGPHSWQYSRPGFITKTGTFGVAETGAEIALPAFAATDSTYQEDGTATLSVTSDWQLLRDGVQIAWDADDFSNLEAMVDCEPGGYTVLHALVQSFRNGTPAVAFTAEHGLITPTGVLKAASDAAGAGWVCELNGEVLPADKLQTTLLTDGDSLIYYYNPAIADQRYARFVEDAVAVERGQQAEFTLLGKPAGSDGGLAPLAGARLLVGAQDSGAVTGADGKVLLNTSSLALGTHVVTATRGEPNALTWDRALLTVSKPAAPADSDSVSFRLVGAAKHSDKPGYGERTSYQNWINPVSYPMAGKSQVSVYEVFAWALKGAGLSWSEQPNYISGIKIPARFGGGMLSELDNGAFSGWTYSVNGVHPGSGLRDMKVRTGDEVIWHYADDFALEVGDFEGAQPPYPGGWLIPPDGVAPPAEPEEPGEPGDPEEPVKPGNPEEPATPEPVKDVERALTDALDYLKGSVAAPGVGTTGGEWAVVGRARAGLLDDTAKAAYLKNLEEYILKEADSYDAKTGRVVLDRRKYTENERVVLALTALGIDASNWRPSGLNGPRFDLVSALLETRGEGSDFQFAAQGINDPIFILISLDAGGYFPDQRGKAVRAQALAHLIANQSSAGDGAEGGWALSGSAAKAEVDITAMALQALAYYYNMDESQYNALGLSVALAVQAVSEQAATPAAPATTAATAAGNSPETTGTEVTTAPDDPAAFPFAPLAVTAPTYAEIRIAVQRAVDLLSARQSQTADYGNAEAVTQAIVALTALGIDPATDERFIKGGKSLIDALLTYRNADGSFRHEATGAYSPMATEQATYALVAYARFLDGACSLYDMKDATGTNVWKFIPVPPDKPVQDDDEQDGEATSNNNNAVGSNNTTGSNAGGSDGGSATGGGTTTTDTGTASNTATNSGLTIRDAKPPLASSASQSAAHEPVQPLSASATLFTEQFVLMIVALAVVLVVASVATTNLVVRRRLKAKPAEPSNSL